MGSIKGEAISIPASIAMKAAARAVKLLDVVESTALLVDADTLGGLLIQVNKDLQEAQFEVEKTIRLLSRHV